MSDTTEQINEINRSIGAIESKLDSLKESIDQVMKHLLGNGQKGILERQAISEGTINNILKTQETILKNQDQLGQSISELADTVKSLTTIVDKHQSNEKLHNIEFKTFLINNWKQVILVALVLYMLYEGGGGLLTLVKTLVGI
jgi:prefoldin subunit 5